MRAPTFVPPDDYYSSEEILSFLRNFADELHRVVKRGYRRIASELIDLLAEPSFEISVFQWYIKGLADHKDIIWKGPSVLMKHYVFDRVLWNAGSSEKNGHYTLYLRDPAKGHEKHG